MTIGARFFFYGTLRDPEVRARVLGAVTARVALVPATAPGWRALYVRGRDFPVLVPRRGAIAPGLLAEGLNRDSLCRLVAYEGRGYRIGVVNVTAGTGTRLRAAAFLPKRRLKPGPRCFDLGDWQMARRMRYLRRLAGRPGFSRPAARGNPTSSRC